MAQGSGPALQGLIPGSFAHQPSGVQYTMGVEDGTAQMRYTRPVTHARGALDGAVNLTYFLGSGHRGRTYLYQREGYWYELPINWYTRRGAWDMLPGYGHAASMPTAQLPADANCLHCHATAITQPSPVAGNRFGAAPFAQGGIGCSACHGDPAAHLRSGGRVAMVDPDKLPAARRDSVCLQCHLEGEALAFLPGKSMATFQPGDNLAETAVYFVRASHVGGGNRATSQYEALLRSACRRTVGDSMTCTTCHDPHASPVAAAERVAWFRGRCLSCHTSPAMATHHPEQQDCASCHMPSRPATDVSHEQVTDHDIEARPGRGTPSQALPNAVEDTLVPVGGGPVGPREQGLAYAQTAEQGDGHAAVRARALLEQAEAAGSNDAVLHSRLGYLLQRAGEAERARAEYIAALNQDVWEPSALANLAVLDASTGHLPEAMRLLDRLLTANPGQTSAGLNLALLDCSTGQAQKAAAVLDRLALFNPDDPVLRRFRPPGN